MSLNGQPSPEPNEPDQPIRAPIGETLMMIAFSCREKAQLFPAAAREFQLAAARVEEGMYWAERAITEVEEIIKSGEVK